MTPHPHPLLQHVRRGAVVAVAAIVLAAGCGDSSDTASDGGGTSTVADTPATSSSDISNDTRDGATGSAETTSPTTAGGVATSDTASPTEVAPPTDVDTTDTTTAGVATTEGSTTEATPPTDTSPDTTVAGSGGDLGITDTLAGPTDYPAAPQTAAEFTARIVATESVLADPTTDRATATQAARVQQSAYRALGQNREWDAEVQAALPEELRVLVADHATARRAFLSMRTTFSDTLPAWEIIEPAPLDDLRRFYEEAEADSGIEWEYLAAINLVESGMGRINGVSTANAQGPMQFLPTTWAEVVDGDITDIRDPRDAIMGAGRYLVRRGGPDDMDRAIFGYNNHNGYVEGVSTYAKIIRENPGALAALYEWEIIFASDRGDVHLPVGYFETEPLPVTDYLARG